MTILQKQKVLQIVFVAFMLLGITACSETDENIPDVSHISVDLKIERADRLMANAETPLEIAEFMFRDHAEFSFKALRRYKYPHDSLFVRELFKLARSPYIDTTQKIIEDVYDPDLSKLRPELENIFRFAKHYFPETPVPAVYTVITGYSPGNDMLVSDSMIMIGLDYYLGPKHSRYRPSQEEVPEYMWRRYSPESLPVHLTRSLSNRFNMKDMTDKTLLNEMIAAGKMLYFTEKILPETPDSLIIGYTDRELADTEASAEVIWGHFVEQKLFYDPSRQAKRNYVQERPFTNEISQRCPGRIGWWLGWQIVRAYAEKHPELTLAELMEMKNAQEIFQKSRYKPRLAE